MVTLIIGGAASGKSAYAEELAMQSPGVPRLYVATMLAQDAESRARVKRHRALRRGKGFFTVECPLALEKLVVPTGAAVLLECLSNLLANECYCPEGARGTCRGLYPTGDGPAFYDRGGRHCSLECDFFRWNPI